MPASNLGPIEQPDEILRVSYAEWAKLYKGNLDAMTASSQAIISGYQLVGAELLAFGQSRMKHALEAGQRMAECTSPAAALDLQMELAKSALKAYVDEFRTVGDLTGKVVTEAVAPLRARAAQVATSPQESVAA